MRTSSDVDGNSRNKETAVTVSGRGRPRGIALAQLLAVLAAAGACLAVAPAMAGFAAAAAAAFLWCKWVEDHPSVAVAAAARVLVCMPTDRPADAELASGRDLADRLGASLIAAYVEPPVSGSESRERSGELQANIRRAKALGARILSIGSTDAAAAPAAVAASEQVTHAVLGRPKHATVFDAQTTTGRFIHLSRGVEILVVDDPALGKATTV